MNNRFLDETLESGDPSAACTWIPDFHCWKVSLLSDLK